MEKIRAFVAIELPEEVATELGRIETELKKGLKGEAGVNWVSPEKIHLTLKFLGYVDEERIGPIGDALEGASLGVRPFTLSSGAVGGFPTLKNPRVLWVGVEGDGELERLWRNVEESLSGPEGLGFGREERDFKPHLTLCRIKSPFEGRALGRAAGGIKTIARGFTVDSFALFKSELNPKGARYTVLRKIPLKA